MSVATSAPQVEPSSLPRMHALVTGATGFIGRALVKRLQADGHSVRVLARSQPSTSALFSASDGGMVPGNSPGNSPENSAEADHDGRRESNLHIIEGELSQPETLAAATHNIDVVFHLGAAVAGTWDDHFAVTVEGTRAMLEESLAAGVRRFIHVSSVAAVDTRLLHDGETMTERIPLAAPEAALGPYARGKVEAELLVREGIERGLNATIIRPGLVYGPGRVLFEHFGRNGSKRLLAYGNSKQRIPMIHLDSLVDALVCVANSPKSIGRSYLAVDDEVQREDYLRMLSHVSGAALKCSYVPVAPIAWMARLMSCARHIPGLTRLPALSATKLRERSKSLSYTTSALKRDTDWAPSRNIQDNLRRAVESNPAAMYPHRKLRVGIVGAGTNAFHHLHSLQKMAGVEVTGILDRRASQAEQLARKFMLSCHFSDAEEFYREARPEVVHVVSPPRTHCQLAVEAMSHGAHVLCEKPMAVSIEECEAMREVAFANQRVLAVPDPSCDVAIARAGRMIARGAIGDVVHIDTTFGFDLRRLAPESSEYSQRLSWMEKLPGGLMEDLAPHALHATLDLARPTDLQLICSDVQHNAPTEPRSGSEVRLMLRGSGGSRVTASVNLSLSLHPDVFTIVIYGKKGTLIVDVQSMIVQHVRLGGGPRAVARGVMIARANVSSLWQMGRNAAWLALGRVRPPGHLLPLFDRFYASLASGGPVVANPMQAQRVVELLREIWPDRKALCLADAG